MFGPLDASCTAWRMEKHHFKASQIQLPSCRPLSILLTRLNFQIYQRRIWWMSWRWETRTSLQACDKNVCVMCCVYMWKINAYSVCNRIITSIYKWLLGFVCDWFDNIALHERFIDKINEILCVSVCHCVCWTPAVPGTKPQRENLYCWIVGASIPSVKTTSIPWTRYTSTYTWNSSLWPYNLHIDNKVTVSVPPCNGDLKKILTDLAALQSPNSIIRAANVCQFFRTFSSNVFL